MVVGQILEASDDTIHLFNFFQSILAQLNFSFTLIFLGVTSCSKRTFLLLCVNSFEVIVRVVILLLIFSFLFTVHLNVIVTATFVFLIVDSCLTFMFDCND